MTTCCLTDRVPAAVRNKIYEYILDDVCSLSEPKPSLTCGKSLSRGALNDYIGLCEVNKQIRAEFRPLLFCERQVYVNLENAPSLFTTILALWPSLTFFQLHTNLALGAGVACAVMTVTVMEGNKKRKPFTHDFLPVSQAELTCSSMAFLFVQWEGYVQQLSQYLNLDMMWKMPTTFANAIKSDRFSSITFKETCCHRCASPSHKWTLMMPKRTGKLSASERVELAEICRSLAITTVYRGESSRWALWGSMWRYPTIRDLLEVAIRVEDKDDVRTEQYV
jgi:hypothetical protein